MKNVLAFVHDVIIAEVPKDKIGIDATLGNGHDTLFLSRHLKTVFAFDIQADAIETAKQNRHLENRDNVRLIRDSHVNMAVYVAANIGVIMFNFGYLPGGDKTITTSADTSLEAVQVALEVVDDDGLVTLVFYPGHPEGKREVTMLLPYLENLDSKTYSVMKYHTVNRESAPFAVIIKKHGG